jgi:DNA modification methylase
MTTERFTLHHGDCLDVLRTLPADSLDAIVTDPPYGLEFMGKEWDAPWKHNGAVIRDPATERGGFQDGAGGNPYSRSRIEYGRGGEASVGFQLWFTEIAVELLRVLKPGGHLLAFGGTRTYHRLACAIEDAGFEIRDSLNWIYGSGFPKSLDVSKAINKAAGIWRGRAGAPTTANGAMSGPNYERTPKGEAATDAAKQWNGWGTALKPAHEPIVLARKPFRGTVAATVLEHGTGALNIDGTRIASNDGFEKAWDKPVTTNIGAIPQNFGRGIGDGVIHTVDLSANRPTGGRWPANVLHDGSPEVVERFPDSKGGVYPERREQAVATSFASGQATPGGQRSMGDDGSAARFFAAVGFDDDDAASFLYCAKPNKRERNAGLGHLPAADVHRYRAGIGEGKNPEAPTADSNIHPTVKPLALMRWLVRLITPPGGTVLDPFAGSGTTLCAAILEGANAVGIEMTDDYLPIIRGRVEWAQQQHATTSSTTTKPSEPEQPTLFE